MSSQPVDGIEVVELGSAISGPFAARLLADYGADVTKLEPLDGDSYRNLPAYYDSHDVDDLTYRFLPYNTSKESVAVDLKTDAGHEIATELIAEADVVLENMRPGVMDRLGLGWDELQAANPDLVYCDITGYGPSGPHVEWPAMDTTVQAIGGWADQIGIGDEPETMDIFMLDQVTAVYAAFAVCMALLGRAGGDGGRRVEISMLDVAVSFLNHHFAEHSAAEAVGTEAKFQGSSAPNDVIAVADGYVALYVADEAWTDFCEAIDRRAWAADDHPYATVDGRLEHREELREDLGEAMGNRPKDEWVTFINEDVDRAIASAVNTVSELFDDLQVQHNDVIASADHPVMGPYTLPRLPLRLSAGDVEISPAPSLGEDADIVLGALGYSSDEIKKLRRENVIL